LVTNIAGELKARIDFPSERKEPVHDIHLRVEVPLDTALVEKSTEFFTKYVEPRMGPAVKAGLYTEIRLAGSRQQDFRRVQEEPSSLDSGGSLQATPNHMMFPLREGSNQTMLPYRALIGNSNATVIGNSKATVIGSSPPIGRTVPREGMLSGITPNYPTSH